MTAKALQALFWKESREHLPRAGLLCMVIGLAGIVTFLSESQSGDVMFLTLLVIVSLVLPLFVVMAIGHERAAGQIDLLASQPVSVRVTFAVKTLLGVATCIAPAVLIAVTGAMFMDKELAGDIDFAWAGINTSLVAAATYLWMAGFAANARNEIRAGFIAMMVWIAWLLLSWIFIVAGLMGIHLHDYWAYVVPPVLGSQQLDPNILKWPPLLIAIFSALVVWSMGAWRFMSLTRPDSAAARPSTLPIAHRSIPKPWQPNQALMMSEFGRHRKWVLIGWAMLVVGAALGTLIQTMLIPHHNPMSLLTGVTIWVYSVLATTGALGIFIIVLFAVTAAADDLEPRRFQMLASRPVSSRDWFRYRYLAGLLGVAVTMAASVVCLIAALLLLMFFADEDVRRMLIDAQQTNTHLLRVIIFIGWGIMAYSIAHAVGCMVQHPVYAAMLAFAAIGLLTMVSTLYDWLAWLDVGAQANRILHGQPWGRTFLWALVYTLPFIGIGSLSVAGSYLTVRKFWPTER